MLAGLGYEPVGFESSTAALAAFHADPQRFDLVLTDEVMPEMTGTELATGVHQHAAGSADRSDDRPYWAAPVARAAVGRHPRGSQEAAALASPCRVPGKASARRSGRGASSPVAIIG